MNPLLMWIERHRREDWAAAGTRQGYERINGPVSDTQWRSAVSQAFQRERVQDRLAGAFQGQTIGDVLKGYLTFRNEVTVRVRVTGTDAIGERMSSIVDVTVGRNDTIADLWRLAHEAIEANPSSAGIQIEELDVAAGTYAT